MIVQCEDCGISFDDATRDTGCPHEQFMSDDDLKQKDLGILLLGRDICFAHQPNGPVHRIQSVGWNGMVTLHDMAGEFAPHLFVIHKGGSHD